MSTAWLCHLGSRGKNACLVVMMEGFSSLIAIMISEITQTFFTFIPSFCNGGLNSEKCLHLERIGFT